MIEIMRHLRDVQDRLERIETVDVLLDDSDTYTPTYIGGTTAGTTTYTFQSGAWKRFGSQIVVIGQINWTAATGTGEARISLPFTPVGYNVSGTVWLGSITFANSTPLVFASPSSGAYFVLDSPLSNAGATRVQVEAAGTLIWQLTYFL